MLALFKQLGSPVSQFESLLSAAERCSCRTASYNTAVNPALAPWAFKQLCELTLKVSGLHSHTNIPSYLRGPIKGRRIHEPFSQPPPPCVIYLRWPYCHALSEGVATLFVLGEARKQYISGPFLLFQAAERARAGLTSVCVQSQAGPEHGVPRWPPSPFPGGLCSRFHAIRVAACFPAQSCQGHKRP